jgi:DnaK suppressor protein
VRQTGRMDAHQAQLEQLRDEARTRIAGLRADVDEVIASASSTTGDDEHDPEGATIGFERAQALALVERAQGRLAEIDAALARVAAGTYGRCTRCGAAIGTERLQARPAAARCVTCASTDQHQHPRSERR